MLLSYKFNNYLSFNQEAEFTMLAPLSKVKSRYPNNYIELANGYSVLKEAVIVGENAGGKSNISIIAILHLLTKALSIAIILMDAVQGRQILIRHSKSR